MSVYLSVHRGGEGVPQPGPDWGGVFQGRYPPSKVGTPNPLARSGRGREYPVPQGMYPSPPGRYPFPPPDQDEGYPKIGTPGIGQHMEYLICGRRYDSCVHVGGLSCSYILSVSNKHPLHVVPYFFWIHSKYVWIVKDIYVMTK